ncbi:ABC transporter permease [Geminicoccus harenae]|uniref:ABC transporter permease n=1 Tax=Geminicoccus harenae TaxID=2498453 RepID=UPI00168AA4EE|nr:ABC transporter permease [Geminicoccus harenae]
MNDLRLRLGQNLGLLLAIGLFLLFWLVYNGLHPKGFSTAVLIQNANESFVIGAVAMAQTVPVLAGGLDLSVGAVMTLVNCLASVLVNGSGWQMVLGIVVCLAAGTLAGWVNGVVVVYGRIQPIIATLATGAVYIGIALFIRPTPGGDVDGDLSWALTNDIYEFCATYGLFDDGEAAWLAPFAWIPMPLAIMLLVIFLVWIPFRNSVTGRGVYAIGSSEGAAYMSGVRIDRCKIAAFTLAGFFAGLGGLYLALQTSSGNADVPQAGAYTLNSIAAVVIGGTSLMGGSGGAICSLIGAMVIRAISFNFRIFDIAPLLQPLFEGIVLLGAVSIGAARVFRVKNRLELLG